MEFPTTTQFYVNFKNRRIHYRVAEADSNSPCICILPGFAAPSSLYYPFMLSLNKLGYTCIAIDYWGRGFSDPARDDDFSIEALSNLVISLLDHRNIEKCNFIGVSFGCCVAALIASIRPDLINRLILLSPFHCNGEPMTPLQNFILSVPILGPAIFKFSSNKTVPISLAMQISDRPNKQELIDEISKVMVHHSKARAYDLSRSIASFDQQQCERAISLLSDINKKIMVIVGECDSMIKLDTCKEWWEKWVPNSRFETIKESGHLLFMEEPDQVCALISNFLS